MVLIREKTSDATWRKPRARTAIRIAGERLKVNIGRLLLAFGVRNSRET
jgi:hypothetical protein